MSRNLSWRELHLEGFGLWREPARFLFPERFGILCLPNERGKSTMLAGLRAILFGLPGESDPARHGVARWRSWGGAPAFCGRIDFAVDGQSYRIERDLESHQTRIGEIDASGGISRLLFEGNANPRGKTPAVLQYREVLRLFLGDLSDEDLFASTFLVEQPVLPAATMKEALGRLISGVGRVGGPAAQGALFDSVKKLTKATADLGLIAPGRDRSANQQTDGALETLDDTIVGLQRERSEAEAAFATQRFLEIELSESIAAEAGAEEEDSHAQTDRAAVETLRRECIARDTARQACEDLKRALGQYDDHQNDATRAKTRMLNEAPDLDGARADLEGLVDAAIGIEQQIAAHETTASRERANLEACRGEAEDAEAALGQDPDLAERPENFPARLAALRSASSRLAEIEAQKRQTREAYQAITERVSAADPWTRLTTFGTALDPPGWLRQVRGSADRWMSAVRRFLGAEELFKSTEAERKKLDAVAVLPPELRDDLLNYPESLTRHTQAASVATRLKSMAEERELRAREFDRNYAALDGIAEERFLATLDARTITHRRLAERVQQMEALRASAASSAAGRRRLRGVLISVPSAAAVVALLLLFGLSPTLAAAGGAFALIVTFWLFGRPSGGALPARALREMQDDVDQMRQRLSGEFIPSGPWLPDDEGIADRAREVFRQRNQDLESLRRFEGLLQDASHLGDPDQARRAASFLEGEARKIASSTGMPAPEAVQTYLDLSTKLQAQSLERDSAWREVAGSESVASETGPPGEADPLAGPPATLSDAWQPLREAVPVLGINAPSLRDLSERLSALRPEDWERWGAEASAYAAALHETEALKRRLDGFDTPDSSGQSEEARLLAEVERLMIECTPFTPSTDPETFNTRWETHRATERRLHDSIRARGEAEKNSIQTEEEIRSLAEQLRAKRTEIGEERLLGAGGSLRGLRDRLAVYRELVSAATTADAKGAGVLEMARGGPFPDREALERAWTEQDECRRDAQSRIDAAVEASDLLRRYGAMEPAEQDRLRRGLLARADEAAATLERARRRHVEASARFDAFEPAFTTNLAAVEIEIEQRRQEHAALRARRDADAKAWHILGEAIREFQATHREALAESLDSRFRAVTKQARRSIHLDPELVLEILEDGRPTLEDQLSQGARDQLSFCLRLAVAELTAGDVRLPMLLDDPFVHSDPERLANIRLLLEEAARDRQIILLTQDDRLASWGERVRIEAS